MGSDEAGSYDDGKAEDFLEVSEGSLVERIIDGMWFVAIIEAIDESHCEVKLRYVDDGNIEERVPFDEVREHRSSSGVPVEFHSQSPTAQNTLLKPLAGLIEDDSEQRRAHRPTVVIHSNADSEEAIILNGAENRLAVGGGLRALRYLKKT